MKNGIDLLVDSNIFIYWLNGNTSAAEILSQNTVFYSIITEIEIKGHASLLDASVATKLFSLLNRFKKIGLTEEIKDLAIDYRTHYNLKTPDAIICATASQLKIPLITADRKVLGVDKISTVLFEPA